MKKMLVVLIAVWFCLLMDQTAWAKSAIKKVKGEKIKTVDCSCEKTFAKSYPVVWSGKVIGVFAGGEDFGVARFNVTDKYSKFYVDGDGKFKVAPNQGVKVTGKMIGMTCAYANSVFGQCVAEVTVDKIEKVVSR